MKNNEKKIILELLSMFKSLAKLYAAERDRKTVRKAVVICGCEQCADHAELAAEKANSH